MGTIWPLDRHITIGITSRPSDQHGRDLGRQITLHEGGEISQKNHRYISDISPIYLRYITDISLIYHRFFATKGDFLKKSLIYFPEPIYGRYFGDIYGNISSPIFLHEISCRLLPIHDISAIYRRYIPIFSSMWQTIYIHSLSLQSQVRRGHPLFFKTSYK